MYITREQKDLTKVIDAVVSISEVAEPLTKQTKACEYFQKEF